MHPKENSGPICDRICVCHGWIGNPSLVWRARPNSEIRSTHGWDCFKIHRGNWVFHQVRPSQIPTQLLLSYSGFNKKFKLVCQLALGSRSLPCPPGKPQWSKEYLNQSASTCARVSSNAFRYNVQCDRILDGGDCLRQRKGSKKPRISLSIRLKSSTYSPIGHMGVVRYFIYSQNHNNI